MGASDYFPIDADRVVSRPRRPNVLRKTMPSGVEHHRAKRAVQRQYELNFQDRPKFHWNLIDEFRKKMLTDFFVFIDRTRGENVQVYFDGEPSFEEVHKHSHNIRVSLVEKQ